MAVPTWSVSFGATTLTDIQSVGLTIGRTKVTDPFRSGNCSITGRRPDLLPTIEVGDTFTASVTWGAISATYHFRVADLQVDYGILDEYDTWTVTGEDAFAVAGRANVSVSFTAGQTTLAAAQTVGTAAGVTVNNTSYPAQSTVKAITITNGNALDILNTLANTEQAYLSALSTVIYFNGRNWQKGATYANVTDDGTGSNPVKYDQLRFTGLADNFASDVLVQIREGSTVSSGTGDYSYTLDTYSETTADALNVAGFVDSQLSVTTAVPASFSILLNAQTNNGWVSVSVPYGVNLKFRGTTYKCFVLGQTVSGDTNSTRITYNVVSADFYSYLILNDATFGTLDYNKLGF